MPTPKILLIDYDPVTVEFTRTSLTQAGFQVEVAADGVAGLEAFGSLHPDLVVVEAMLPKKHGFEVCQEIKSSEAGQSIPVVITTASYSGRKYRSEALSTYLCDEYLEKPIGKGRLLSVCRELLSIDPSAMTQADDSQTAQPEFSDRREADSLPDLTEMSDDELSARLDDLVHATEDETPGETGAAVQQVRAEMVEDGSVTEASHETVPQLAQVTEEDIVDCLDSALVRSPGTDDLFEVHPAPVPSPTPAAAATPTAKTVVEPTPVPRPAPKKAAEPPASRPVAVAAKQIADPVTTLEKPEPRPPAPARKTKEISERRSETAGEIAAKIALGKPTATATASRPARPARTKWAVIAAGLILLTAAAGTGWYFTRPATSAPTQPAASAPSKRIASTPRNTPQQPVGDSTTSVPDRSTMLPVDPNYNPGPIDNLAGRMKQTAAVDARTAPPETKPATAKREAAPPEPTSRQTIPVVAANPTESPVGQPASASPETTTPPAVVQDAEASTVAAELVVPSQAPTRFEARRLPNGASKGSTLQPVSATPEPALIPALPLAAGALVEFAQLDVAPRPLKQTMPEYHPQARLKGQEGVVRFELLVNHEGKVEDARLVEGIPGSRLNDAALREARGWTYRPAFKDGVPVRTWVRAQVEFRL